MTKSLTSWLVPSFSQHYLHLVVSGRCLHVSVTKFQDKFASLRQVNSPYSWNKFQICCTDMYLIRFLPNFAVFFVFLWITRDFADLPEFHGSATARNIRSPVFIRTSCYSHINKPVNRFICMWKQDDLQKKQQQQGPFQPRPYPKARALSAKLQKWSSEFFTHSGSEEYHLQKLRIFLKRSQNWQNDFENAVFSNLTLSLKTFNKKLRPSVLKEANSKELEKESIHRCLTPFGAWINFLWNRFKNTTFGELTSFIPREKFKNYSISYS